MYLLEIFMIFGIAITHGWGRDGWKQRLLCVEIC